MDYASAIVKQLSLITNRSSYGSHKSPPKAFIDFSLSQFGEALCAAVFLVRPRLTSLAVYGEILRCGVD